MRDAILQLFPGAVAGRDFTLRDDGDGPFIAEWNLAAPEPTPQQLLVAARGALQASLCRDIDQAADQARALVAGDPLRAVEYEKAAAEAQAFKDAGYPAGAAPRMVAAWAIGGRSAKDAADNILAEAAAYNNALYQLREIRLAAKQQVRQAMFEEKPVQAAAIATGTIAAIKAAVAGIGNSGGQA